MFFACSIVCTMQASGNVPPYDSMHSCTALYTQNKLLLIANSEFSFQYPPHNLHSYFLHESHETFCNPYFIHIFFALWSYNQIPIVGDLGCIQELPGSFQYLQKAHILTLIFCGFISFIDNIPSHKISVFSETRNPYFSRLPQFPKSRFHLYFSLLFCNIFPLLSPCFLKNYLDFFQKCLDKQSNIAGGKPASENPEEALQKIFSIPADLAWISNIFFCCLYQHIDKRIHSLYAYLANLLYKSYIIWNRYFKFIFYISNYTQKRWFLPKFAMQIVL